MGLLSCYFDLWQELFTCTVPVIHFLTLIMYSENDNFATTEDKVGHMWAKHTSYCNAWLKQILPWGAEPSWAPLCCSPVKWEAPHVSPKSAPVFPAWKQHSHRACEGLLELLLSWKHPWVRQSGSKLSCCAVLIKPSCLKEVPEHPLPTALPNHHSVPRGLITVLGTWQKTFLKGKNNPTVTPSHLWPSGLEGC